MLRSQRRPLTSAAPPPAKRGPKPPLADAALLARIRADLAASPFTGEGHRKVRARLHFVAGHKVGRNRVLRLRRAHRLLSPHRAAAAPAKAHDGRSTTAAPNLRWATDGSKIWTRDDGWVWLGDLVEHWNGECLGWPVCKIGHRFAAWEPLAQALAGTRGGVPGAARGIELRHDHGSQYFTDYFPSTGRCHGLVPSFARLGEPETNGVVERFHRTLKEQISHGRTYQNLAELRTAVAALLPIYNHHWRLEKLRYQATNPASKSALLSTPPCPWLPKHSYPGSNQPGAIPGARISRRSFPTHPTMAEGRRPGFLGRSLRVDVSAG